MRQVTLLSEQHKSGLYSIVAPLDHPTASFNDDDVFFQDMQVVHYQLFDFRDVYNIEVFNQKHDDLYWMPPQDFGPADASDAYEADEFSDFENEALFGDDDDDLLEPEDDFEHLALREEFLAYDCLPELISRANQAGVVLYESCTSINDLHDDYAVYEAKDEQALRYINEELDADVSEEVINSLAYDLFVATNECDIYSVRLGERMRFVRERYLDGEGIDDLCSEVVGAVAKSPLHKELATRIADQYFPGNFESLRGYFASLEMNMRLGFSKQSQEVHKFLLQRLTPDMHEMRKNAQNGE